MAKNGHYYHHQRNEHRLETQMRLDSGILIFFLSFFFSHHLTIIYSQTTCMEWQPGQPQQMTTLSRTMNRGLEMQMMCFESLVCFFLSFFFFVLLTNIYNLTTLRRQSHTTSTSTTNRAWDSDVSHALGIYFYFWHNGVRVWDASWSVSTSRDVLFFSIYV